ncbi:Flp pilus assembly protein CpaB [Alkalihalobacillus sp. AL-G]|uniref:Flp pilus assembly protein CpaB n=1 Tax=Alkalihalobacillus sp. AL-G TaxID=2926399 RepID=UPI00272C7589|nr:Flp pilus assembly protein CpaB [Alkalihalobacillus sp. AL-G]WLD93941.1 Flp pilus assembly protein CpaB [Alkalihalobacillus sp. AL-G]
MRSKLVLMLAIIMGIITTVLFFNYMKQYDSETVSSQTKVEVVVATGEIKRNHLISKNMLELKPVPEQSVHENTVTEIEDAIGLVSTANIVKGETLLSNHLQNTKEESLFVSRKVRDGFRAVSVGLNFPQSVSNLIEPEDNVDVIATFKEGDKFISEIIVENTRVLAVGRRMLESTEGEPYVEYTSATLELRPEEAVKVVNSNEKGNIHIALRSRVEPKGAAEDDN